MKIILELHVDPLGLPPNHAAKIVERYLPSYIVHDSLTVEIEAAKILRVVEVDR